MTDGAQDWSAYWAGRGQAGEAFTGAAGVETHPGLAAFWDDVFSDASPAARVLDVACGAGTVLRRARAAGLADLTGVDVSADALALLREGVGGVRAVRAPADALPFGEGDFDLVASQFGFEYAGDDAPAEMARVLSPGGRLVALVHRRGSSIEREVTAHGEHAEAVAGSGFAEAGRALAEAEFAHRAGHGTADDVRAARARFAEPERTLAGIVRAQPGGVAQHLYEGFRQLYERQRAYDLADITGWLDGMAGEVAAYAGRMTTMRAAARDEAAMAGIAERLAAGGMRAEVQAFAPGREDGPFAWRLIANKD